MALFYAFLTLILASFIGPLIFFIFKYAMIEKTYDERMAEQRKKLAMEHHMKAKSKHQQPKKSVNKTEKKRAQSEKKAKIMLSSTISGKEMKKNESPKNVASSDKIDGSVFSKKKLDKAQPKSSTSSQSSKTSFDHVDDQICLVDDDYQDNIETVTESDSSIVVETGASSKNLESPSSICTENMSNPQTVSETHSGNEMSSVIEKVVSKKIVQQQFSSQSESSEKNKHLIDQLPKRPHSKHESSVKQKSDETGKDSKSPKQKIDEKQKEDDTLKIKFNKTSISTEPNAESAASNIEKMDKGSDSLSVHENTFERGDANINSDRSPNSSKKHFGKSNSPGRVLKSQRLSTNNKSSKKQTSDVKNFQKISNEANGSLDTTLLIPLLGKAELSRSEIQGLIDLLLNKQQESGSIDAEWIGSDRQDPMVKIKKQLAEKEKALAAEQEAHQAIQTKLKELRNELNAEKYSNRQREESRQTDFLTLNARIQALTDEKQKLTNQFQQIQTDLNQERHITSSLKQENSKNKDQLQRELLHQRQQLEMHISQLNEQHSQAIIAMDTQMSQLHVRLQEQDNANVQMNEENAILRDRIAMLDNQINHFQQNHHATQDLIMQLEEFKNIKSVLDQELRLNVAEVNRLNNEFKSITDQLNRKTKEVENLNHIAQNMKIENEELRKENARNNDQIKLHFGEKSSLQLEIENLKKHLVNINEHSQDSSTLEELKHQLAEYESLLADKNNELQKLQQHISYLETKSNNSLQVDDQDEKITELTNLLQKQQEKNNDLRIKNWKAMEALSNLQKSEKHKAAKGTSPSLNEIVSKEREVILEKIKCWCSTAAFSNPPDSYEDNIWFEYLEKEFGELLVQNSITNKTLSADDNAVSKENKLVLDELEKQNNHLQTMVSHYKSIIADTEGMLNSLQKHVEQEETRWSDQVRLLDEQVHVLNKEVQLLQDQLKINACSMPKQDILNCESKLSNCVENVPLLPDVSAISDNSVSCLVKAQTGDKIVNLHPTHRRGIIKETS